jgi:PKD repeat protein
LTTALTQAGLSGETDTIDLAAGTYTGQFSYDGASDVTITGAGQTATTLANSAGNQAALRLHGSGRVVAQRLGVLIPSGTTAYGLLLNGVGVVVQDVQIVDQSAGMNAMAVVSFGGTLRRSTISGPFNRGVWAEDNATTVDAVTFTGTSTALESEDTGTTMTATHVRTTGVSTAAKATGDGSLLVTDSLLRIGASALFATLADDNNNSTAFHAHLSLVRDTLVAGGSGQRGVAVLADRRDAMSATVTDTILSGFAPALQCSATNDGSATITATNVAYDGALDTSGCPAGSVRQTGSIVGTPQFANAAAGDFHLLSGSPLLDVSDAVPLGATDLDGHARPAAGSAACVRRGDVGAYELLTPPAASASADRASAPIGTAFTLTAAAACDATSAAGPSYHWSFDDGASADGRVAAHAFAAAGPHVATLTVTNALGQTAVTQVSVAVTALSSAPSLLRILRFTAPRAGFVLGRGVPRTGGRAGHALTIELSGAATVTLRATRLVAGRLHSGRCGSANRAPHGRRCTRRLPVRATASLALPAGTSLVAFAGWLTARAALQPGRYELALTARDAAGLSSASGKLTVAIHRSPRRHRRSR